MVLLSSKEKHMLPVRIGIETVPSADCQHGHASVGVAAAVVEENAHDFDHGIVFYASSDNTDTIWIGKTGVTADSNVLTGGFPLVPGSGIVLPISEMANLYAISGTASQDLAWLGF